MLRRAPNFYGKYRRWWRRGALALLAALGVYRLAFDEGFRAPRRTLLTEVQDGDTVTVSGFGRCRLLGIDTPEIWRFQDGEWRAIPDLPPSAYAAGEWLKTFINREVRVLPQGKDRYDRWLVRLILPGGIDASDYIRDRGWQKKDARRR
ncbi:hypothetical protein FACS1894139_15650 [Planctomycetales bacterium]|nr:hypothetical protein FACS1894108_11560 [Planctomycetales bacterium]GHT07390.1 hypothetical protein FACS1894139_15650 [Planctomycetales bacterium]GHV19827.1 hypothetical protein AGMMS49959_05840 [Planctomycetales bacterium]